MTVCPPLVEVTWTDPVTGTHGYFVIDRLIQGMASGGLRVRKGCTVDEVRGLARAMTLKEALVYDPDDHYVPLGGAKGGVDADPQDPDKEAILQRFLQALLPTVRQQWCLGEDFGVRQETLEKVAAEIGLTSTIEPLYASIADPDAARQRMRNAFGVDVEGVTLDELVGGYGVAAATRSYLGDLSGKTAVVQGFGSIGGAAARYLAQAGARVVAVADRDGVIADDSGLDVERLLAARDPSGLIDRSAVPGATLRPSEEWLDIPCDVLAPCAVSYVIDDASRVRADVVVEGANMATLPEAEAALATRGVAVIPDFLANVGANAWWWWLIYGDVSPTPEASFAKLDALMERLVDTARRGAEGGTLRDGALELVERNQRALAERFGEDPSARR